MTVELSPHNRTMVHILVFFLFNSMAISDWANYCDFSYISV